MFEKSQAWAERLQELLKRITAEQERLLSELQMMNPQFEKAPSVGASERSQALPFGRVEEIYRSFSYVNKWSAQLQERIVQLSL